MLKIRQITTILLLIVFLCTLCLTVSDLIQQRESTETYDAAMELALSSTAASEPASAPETEPVTVPETEPTEPEITLEEIPIDVSTISDYQSKYLYSLSIASLQATNPNTIGWIYIPYSNINDPLMQGADNDYYLEHTWDDVENNTGAIYMDYRNSDQLTNFNTLIYGHNMANQTMFGPLHKYWDYDYLKGHKFVYIVTQQQAYRYRIFSMREIPDSDIAFNLEFESTEDKLSFLNEAIDGSRFGSYTKLTETDHILTLVTCSNYVPSNRWVVQAYLDGIVAQ